MIKVRTNICTSVSVVRATTPAPAAGGLAAIPTIAGTGGTNPRAILTQAKHKFTKPPMKSMFHPLAFATPSISFAKVLFAFTILLLIGCTKQGGRVAEGWSPPIKITESEDGLGGWVDLYQFHNTIIGFQPLRDSAAKCFLLNPDLDLWSKVSLANLPGKHGWVYPLI